MAAVTQKQPDCLKGTIKAIKRQEGFGFVSEEATGEEYFFHRSVVKNASWSELEPDLPVEFQAIKGPKGMRASEVWVLE